MFVGHAAVAALAGAARPRVPLFPLLLATYGADAIEILLHGLGHGDSAMLWTHSLGALLAGGLISGAVAGVFTRSREVAIVVGLVYLSHGLCDLFTGQRKPVWDGGPTYGFGLYLLPAVDFAIEIGLVLVAAVLYQARRPVRMLRVVLAVTVLVLLQLGFNAADRSRLRGLKHGLVRATGAVLSEAPPSPGAGPVVGDRMALALRTTTSSESV